MADDTMPPEIPMTDPIGPVATMAAPSVRLRPRRKQRSLDLDKTKAVNTILTEMDIDLQDREDWLNNYTSSYAKYRGWTEDKEWPYPDCSNAHLPVIPYNCQRLQAALFNAVNSARPPVSAKAWHQVNARKQDRIDRFLEWQVFVEMEAEPAIDDFIHNFVVDPLAVVIIPWVKDRRKITESRTVSALPDTKEEELALLPHLEAIIGGRVLLGSEEDEKHPHRFHFQYQVGERILPGEAETFARKDGRVEIVVTRTMDRYNGPKLLVKDIEDVIFPAHGSNPQPRCPQNPMGAHHLCVLDYLTLDEVRRRRNSGEYDLLSTEDMKKIEKGAGETESATTAPKEQKDSLEGVHSQGSNTEVVSHTIVTAYYPWDIDGDGLDEECVFTIAKEARVLCRAKALSEVQPNSRRPIVAQSILPVPNRTYGISIPMLLEAITDSMDTFWNQAIDNGTMTNVPFFFYDPAGNLKPEQIRLSPGEGYPVIQPRENIYFPTFNNSNQAWAQAMIGLANQFAERLAGQSAIQFSQIPTGKASALRTVGTTMALMNQGDVRTEEVLRRLFRALASMYAMILELDQAFMEPGKEFRLLGPQEQGQDLFDRIASSDEVSGRYTFDFQATMLQANPQIQQALATTVLATMVSPLMVQLGIVDAETIYNMAANFLKAHKADVQRCIKKPETLQAGGPRITAEEVISMLFNGDMPEGFNTLEPLEQHLEKLTRFVTEGRIVESEGLSKINQFSLMPQASIPMLKAYIRRLQDVLARQQQQQAIMQAATMFQQQMGQQGGGAGQGVPSMGAPPEVGEGISPGGAAPGGIG